jgi:hypothetical protein
MKLSEDDKRFFALFLKQRKHEAKFGGNRTVPKTVEEKYEREFEIEERLKKETRGLIKKWEKTGLLDGIKSDIEKTNMAVLIESKPCIIMENSEKIVTDE